MLVDGAVAHAANPGDPNAGAFGGRRSGSDSGGPAPPLPKPTIEPTRQANRFAQFQQRIWEILVGDDRVDESHPVARALAEARPSDLMRALNDSALGPNYVAEIRRFWPVQLDRTKTRQASSPADSVAPMNLPRRDAVLRYAAAVARICGVPEYVVVGMARTQFDIAAHQGILSGQELETLQLVADGHTIEAIASIRNSTPGTVRDYLARAARKLDAHGQIHTVNAARWLGLIDSEVAEALPESPGDIGLTDREIEVLGWAGRGLSFPAIADKMELSLITVKMAMAGASGKLGTHGQVPTVMVAQRRGLIHRPRPPKSVEELRLVQWHRARLADRSELPKQSLDDYLGMHHLEMEQAQRWLTNAGLDPDSHGTVPAGPFPLPTTTRKQRPGCRGCAGI